MGPVITATLAGDTKLPGATLGRRDSSLCMTHGNLIQNGAYLYGFPAGKGWPAGNF